MPQPAVAAAVELCAPDRTLDAAEPVARRACRSDPPARRRNVRAIGESRSQDEEQGATILGREVQPAALLQGQTGLDKACDRAQGPRAQSLFNRPIGVRVALHREQQQAARVEPQTGKAVPVGEGMVPRDDEQSLSVRRSCRGSEVAGDERHSEAECCGLVLLGCGHDLVQCADREPTARQMIVDRHDSEGQVPRRRAHPLVPLHALAQAGGDRCTIRNTAVRALGIALVES